MKLYILLAYITVALASCQTKTSLSDFSLEAVYVNAPLNGPSSVLVNAVEVPPPVTKISWSILTVAPTDRETLFTAQSASSGFDPTMQGITYTSHHLTHGGLHPIAKGLPNLRVNSLDVVPGDSPSFITTQHPPPAPDAYCLVPGDHGTLLAVNGMTDQWALCPNATAGNRLDVVLSPTAGNPHYVLEKCSKVYLNDHQDDANDNIGHQEPVHDREHSSADTRVVRLRAAGMGRAVRREFAGSPHSSKAMDHQQRATGAGLAGVGAARFYASMAPPTCEPRPQPRQGMSSWGRNAGKRLSAGLTRLFGSVGTSARPGSSSNAGVGRQHAKFSFEPPVPITSPPASPLSSEPVMKRRPSPPTRSPRRGHNASQSTSSSTSSSPSVGHRSGTKPRSLDLGLGLAWAPNKLREDAVLPASPLARSLDASRRVEQGQKVAEEFRNVLDDDGYRSFKHYVHRFDMHEMSIDGSAGIVARVERLLKKTRHLSDEERARLMDSFVRIILQAS
ncbi:unnamed protein product [Mycena citricolor]|uniref:Uncharacterized protein n=1 Tax=Mycena citricolor TaxID=2018698 RepID=A0AAD2HJZ3_9AGAR|nr:unnamed protein product [Mycena citricolor]